MDTIMWICVSMLALIGIACILGDMAFLRRSRKLNKSEYRVITLYDDPAVVEALLNKQALRQGWNGPDGAVLLVDMGMGEEAMAACRRVMPELYGAFLCTEAEAGNTLRKLDGLLEETRGQPE